MLTVTEAAREQLTRILSTVDATENSAVRLVPSSKGFKLQVDRPRPDDESYSHEGNVVLVLDKEVSQMLSDKKLGVQSTQDRKRLTLV